MLLNLDVTCCVNIMVTILVRNAIFNIWYLCPPLNLNSLVIETINEVTQ